MTLLVRRFVAEYRRNPVNLLLVVLVPVAFVVVAAGPLAQSAELLGGRGGPAVEVNTAGWAAGYLSAVAMYFQVTSAADVDRRLVLAGLAPWRLVVVRMVTALGLGLLASGAALIALAARTGVDDPVRVAVGTVMFAVVYLAIGAVVGSRVRDPVNGTVTILFVWILDVFFGPTMGALDRLVTRGLPTHFVSLFMVDLPSRHGGRLGDLGWASLWTAAAVFVAFAVVSGSVRGTGGRLRGPRAGSFRAQVGPALRSGLRGLFRNRVLWGLLVAVPSVFVLLADAVTPDQPIALPVVEGGRDVVRVVSMVRVHGGTMAPIAVASLAALIGLFTVLDSRAGDQRLALAGMRPGRLLLVRLALAGVGVVAVTLVSLAVTATVFDPEQPVAYVVAVLVIAVVYVLVGMVIAPLFGRVAGVLVAFLLPFLDLAIAQSPMLRSAPATWERWLPGYGGMRVLTDAAVTPGFDAGGPLLAGVLQIAALAALVALATLSRVLPARGAGRRRGFTEPSSLTPVQVHEAPER